MMIEIEHGLWYEEETGLPWSSKKAGGNKKVTYDNHLRLLTGKNKYGYLMVSIDRNNQLWHRLIYQYFHGPIPVEMTVDHIDNNPLNNRIDNLQLLSQKDNTRYQKIYNTNKSGLPGVYWFKRNKKWRANITIDSKTHHLGYFDNINDAYYCYYKAKIKHHGSESVRCYPAPISVTILPSKFS